MTDVRATALPEHTITSNSPASNSPTRRRVLVVCTGNSARSIMAEALFQALGRGTIEVASAGSAPTGRVHPLALEQISQLPVDTSQFTSKSLPAVLEATEAEAPFDLVVTVCDHAASTCGPLPGDPATLHWGLPDPAAHGEGEEARQAFSSCFDELAVRINALLAADLA
jgi:arsenate reductase